MGCKLNFTSSPAYSPNFGPDLGQVCWGSGLNLSSEPNYGSTSQSTRDLAEKDTGWHFGAMHASERKLLDFQIKDMVIKMQQLASELWDMLGFLLSANLHKAHHGVSPDADEKVPVRETNVLPP